MTTLSNKVRTYLSVRGLVDPVLDDVAVHVDHAQEVETERRSQTTQQPGGRREGVIRGPDITIWGSPVKEVNIITR